jgi:hypothetical protein
VNSKAKLQVIAATRKTRIYLDCFSLIFAARACLE